MWIRFTVYFPCTQCLLRCWRCNLLYEWVPFLHGETVNDIHFFSLQPSRCANFPNISKSVFEDPVLFTRKQLCMHFPTPIYGPIDALSFLETLSGTWLWQSFTQIACCLPSMLELASKSLPVINRLSAIKFQWQVGRVGLRYVFGRNLLAGIVDEIFIRILTWMTQSHLWVFSIQAWSVLLNFVIDSCRVLPVRDGSQKRW